MISFLYGDGSLGDLILRGGSKLAGRPAWAIGGTVLANCGALLLHLYILLWIVPQRCSVRSCYVCLLLLCVCLLLLLLLLLPRLLHVVKDLW